MPLAILTKFSAALGRALLGASRDLAPIITVIALFQVLVLHQPFPELFSILTGLGLVIVGQPFQGSTSVNTLEVL